MQDNNPIDDAGFDALLKEHGVQPQQQAEASNAWSEFDLGPAEEPSFMDVLHGRNGAGVTDGSKIVNHVEEAVKHPIETLKGAVKSFPEMGRAIDTGLQETGKVILNPVADFLGVERPKGFESLTPGTQAYEDIQSAITPKGEAQETGSFVAGLLPVERGINAVKPLVKAGEKYLEKKGAEKTANFVKDLITPELSASKTTTAIKTGKVKEGGIFKDRDITEAVPFFKDIEKVVSEVPGISKSKTLLENSNAIHDHIGTVADDLVSQLKTHAKDMKIANLEQVPAKFNQYMKGVKTTLKENPTLVGDAEKTATKILNKFESLVKEEGSTPDAILSARKKLDTWMSTQKGENIFDPKTEGAVSVALRAIRQGGNDFISSLAKDANGKEIVKVKDMLAKQTSLYDAIENIAPKAAKEGASGFKRWVKSHPKVMGAAKWGASAAGFGGAGYMLNQ